MIKVELTSVMVCEFYLGEAAAKLNWPYNHKEVMDVKQNLKYRIYHKTLKT